ncbi:MAG: hypothetical protein KUG54_00910 [Gammaproteobacteria bacterium]|nr:hypothetical protein [Gammaproteobacteria bacterium]
MNQPVDEMGLPPVLAGKAQAAVDICGDDAHREGEPAAIVKLLEEVFENEETRETAMGMVEQGVAGERKKRLAAENLRPLVPKMNLNYCLL